MVYGDAVFVDDTDQFIGYFPMGQFGTSSIERDDFICQPAIVFRAAYGAGADRALEFRVALHHGLGRVDQAFSCRREVSLP